MKTANRTATGLLLLLVIVAALVTYKSAGAVRAVNHARTAGALSVPADVIPLNPTVGGSTLSRTFNYLAVVWPALAFGILISAAVRSYVPAAAVADLFRRGPIRAHLAAGASGFPLMLCSCCVAPIFSAVYERSARLGPSLALMLAAPALNPAALILTFVLFSPEIASARLAMSIVAVFAGTAVVARICGTHGVTAFTPVLSAASCDTEGSAGLRFVRSCIHIAARTIPLVVVGVLAGMFIAAYLPVAALTSSSAKVVTIAVIASLAVPIALPTFFEVPLALALVGAGAPAGAAAAVLFAGPAVNLPSLLAVGQSAGWRVPAGLALMVWLVAVAGALLVN